MRVLVIPEDFRKDQYMLKPIITALMKSLGKPSAKIRICQLCPEDIGNLEDRIKTWITDYSESRLNPKMKN